MRRMKRGKGVNIRQKNGVSSSLRNAPLHSKPECMQQKVGLSLICVSQCMITPCHTH